MMYYENDSLSSLVSKNNSITNEFEVRTEDGLIKEIILRKRNDIPVDSNEMREVMQYDDKQNPLYKIQTGNFSRLLYFNKRNLTQYSLYRNGKIQQYQSFNISYQYDEFNNPIETTTDIPGSVTTYSNYDCAMELTN